MDDLKSFEDRLTDELGRMAGPEPHVDALAVAHTVAEQAPKRRFPIMFSAVKFVLAGAIVALFGGFLLAGVLTTQQEEVLPPGAEASPEASAQLTGQVFTGDVPRPDHEARLTVTLIDASNLDAPPLDEWVLDRVEQVPEPYLFTIEYAPDQISEGGSYLLEARVEETLSGKLHATAADAVAVITDGNPISGISIMLVSPTGAQFTPRLSGVVMAGSDIPDPDGDVRYVVALVDASAPDDAAPLGEFVVDGVGRLRPPRTFSIDFAADAIDESGTYLLETRIEDAASGTLLATGKSALPVITSGNPVEGITIRLVPTTGDTE